MRKLLFVAAVVGVTIAAFPVTVSAGGSSQFLNLTLESRTEPLTFSVEPISNPAPCLPGTATITSVIADNGGADVPVTPISFTQSAEPGVYDLVLPSATPPGSLYVSVSCNTDAGKRGMATSLSFGALAVTKVVEGTVPTGAGFGVHVACTATEMSPDTSDYTPAAVRDSATEYAVDLAFGPTGGVKYVYFDGQSDCVITEPVNGGASVTTIIPDHIVNNNPDAYASTVTNTFPVEVEPTFTG